MSKRPEVSSSVIRHGNGAGKRGKAAVDVSTKDRKSKLTGRRVSEGRVSKSLDRMKQRNSRRTEYEKQSNRPIDKKRRAATPVHPAPLGGACCRRSLHTMQTRLKSRASGNT